MSVFASKCLHACARDQESGSEKDRGGGERERERFISQESRF